MKYSKKRLIGITVLATVLIAAIGFVIYASDYYHADSTVLIDLNSTNSYTVKNTDDSITFAPAKNESATEIIFYPGGKVQPEAYSVIASMLAQNG